MLEGEMERLVHMEDRLAGRVIGQAAGDRGGVEAVRRGAAGLQDPTDRLARLFSWDRRAGKTELARALAEFLFDDETNMVRLDMSEYMEKHTVAPAYWRLRAMSVTTKADSLPRRCGGVRTAWCCSMRSKSASRCVQRAAPDSG